MAARISVAVGSAFDLLFPPQCALCQAEIDPPDDPVLLCEECRSQILSGASSRCPRCGGSASQPVAAGARCGHCRDSRFHFSHAVALAVYRGPLKDAVLRMKRPQGAALTITMAELFWQARGHEIAALEPDLIVPIPMNWRRRLARGANNPELLAEMLGRRLRLPVARRLLSRGYRPPQGGLTRSGRLVNLRGSMRLGWGRKPSATRVLLVDDVLTTGATCSEAARVLRKAGVGDVMAAVVARGEGDD